MLKGFIFALGACLLWGLVFALPCTTHAFSPLVITLGRCLIFGLFSFTLFLFRYPQLRPWLTRAIFQRALILAFIANIIHYMALVLGIKHGEATVTTLILSLNPLTVALCAHYQKPILKSGILTVSVTCIGLGLCLLQWPLITNFSNWSTLGSTFIFGGIALASWTWFIIANASFVRKHNHIPMQDLVTLIGTGTGLCMLFIFPLFGAYTMLVDTTWIQTPSDKDWTHLLTIISLLGVGSSWIAHYLWNLATKKLPLIFISFLTIFETVFGLSYIYLLESKIPTALDLLAMTAILSGISMVLYSTQRAKLA